MNYNKDITKFVLLISTLIILLFISYYFLLSDSSKQEQLKLPNINEIHTINLKTLKLELDITNKVEITKIVNIIKTSKQTRKQSITDYPMNATQVITITFSTNKKDTTIYLYKQNDKYYIEQPYNTINTISKNNFNIIDNLII